MIDREELQPNREYVDAAIGTTDQAAPTDLQADPWYKRYLEEMKKRALGKGQEDDQGSSPSRAADPYSSFGKGLNKQFLGGKGLVGAFLADGGAVAGPTLALIGEGGEPEYVVPKSKALPFAQHTMRTGNPPNPAKLSRTPKAVSVETVTVSKGGDPSTEGELPAEAEEEAIEGAPQETEAPAIEATENDPILAAIKELTAKVDALAGAKEQPPSMANGGKVMPRVPRPKVPCMADGGMVLPQYGPPKPFLLPPNPANPYTQPDLIMDAPPDLPVNSAAPTFPGAMMPQLQRPTRPIPPRMTGAADRYAALLKAAPKQNWYEAMLAQPGSAGNTGSPKTQPYANLGAGIRNTIGALLPGNRKQAQYGRELESAKAEVGAEKQANADAREEAQLQAQMELNRARLGSEEKQGALYDKQAAKLDQPEKAKKSDLEEKLELFDKSFPGADPAVRQQLFGIKQEKPEKPESPYTGMEQVTDERGNVSFVPINAKTGTVGEPIKTSAKGKGKESAPGGGKNWGDNPRLQSIAREFDSHPIVKDFNVIAGHYNNVKKIIEGGNGGPEDLAVVYEFMKALDPTSVVRESEYQSAAQSGNIFKGAFAKFNGMFNAKGGFLSPEVKQSFSGLLDKKMGTAAQQMNGLRSEYGRKINKMTGSGDGEDYLTNYGGLIPSTSPSTGGQPTQHKAGDKVMLGGREVTIKKINADGTFEY